MPAHWQALPEAANPFRGSNENVPPCQNNEKWAALGSPLKMEKKTPHFSQSLEQVAPISRDLRCQSGLQSFWEGMTPGVDRAPFVINENQANRDVTTAQTLEPAGVTTSNVEPTVRACSTYTDFDTSNDWAASGDFELFDDFDLFGESEAHLFGDESAAGLPQSSIDGSFNISSQPSSSTWENSVESESLETSDTPWTSQEYVPPTTNPSWNVEESDEYDCNVEAACDMRFSLELPPTPNFLNEDEQVLKRQHKSWILNDLKGRAIQKLSKFRRRALDKTLGVRLLKGRLEHRV